MRILWQGEDVELRRKITTMSSEPRHQARMKYRPSCALVKTESTNKEVTERWEKAAERRGWWS